MADRIEFLLIEEDPSKEINMITSMSKSKLEKTSWAREFKKCAPVSYTDALKFALDPSLRVEIVHADVRGEGMEWGITAGDHAPDFLMEICPSKKDALALCREMGWKVL